MVIAHRGASAYAPENTLAAFRLAADQGAHAIELDAKLSADGIVVVHHDLTLDRTTNGSGPLSQFTAAELTALDAGAKFDPQFQGEPLPTLEQVFDAVGQKVLINVELTNYAHPGDDLVAKTVDLVRRFSLESRVIFSSFLPHNLAKAGRLLPESKRAMLSQPGLRGWLARSFLTLRSAPQALHPYFSDVTAGSVAHEHRRGRLVNPWTVNDPAELRRLSEAGVDGLITDDPPAALRVVEEYAARLRAAGNQTRQRSAW